MSALAAAQNWALQIMDETEEDTGALADAMYNFGFEKQTENYQDLANRRGRAGQSYSKV